MSDRDEFGELELRMQIAWELQSIIRASKQRTAKKPEHSALENPSIDLPRWPSGFFSDFDVVLDGFQGITLIGGRWGTGKSLAALACALKNAHQPGQCVIYLDSENPHASQKARALRWYGGREGFVNGHPAVSQTRFFWFSLQPGMSWHSILDAAAERIMHDHENVLFVFDSVQSVARTVQPDMNALRASEKLYEWADSVMRQSDGRIRSLMLSELNASEGIKGVTGAHLATMILRFERADEEGENFIRVHLDKNRNERRAGDLGLYEISWRTSTIRKVGYA